MPKTTEKKVLATVSVPVQISEEQISNMLCSAFDPAVASTSYWAGVAGYEYPAGKTEDDFEYCYMEVVLAGGKMFLYEIEEHEGSYKTAPRKEKWTLTREKLILGLATMSQLKPGEGGHHFGNVVSQNDDGETADVFVQCCLFGEIVYG